MAGDEENNLKEVYHNVFESSKQIVKKNQRNLFINTLDLITRTTNTISAKFLTNDIIKFLYTDILELVFDEDIHIQNNAIIAMDTILKTVSSNSFQDSVEWPVVRANIIQNYAQKLHSLRSQNNCNWYKVWCLIMRILNQEIIRSASTINIFLSVVELGFRSSNHQVRAESFKSWKVLVEIFSKYDLTSLKRIKLISIPLRSSQAKTELTALHKFKVWWYFMIKLQENGRLLQTSEQTFEPFLIFCFGSNEGSLPSQLKSYVTVKAMAVISLIEMLNFTTTENNNQMEKFELEKTSANIITEDLFKKHFEIIIRSVYAASVIVVEEFVTKQEVIFKLLWKSVIDHIIHNDVVESYKKCFDFIILLMKKDNPDIKGYLTEIINLFGNLSVETNQSQFLNVEKVASKIYYFSNFLFSLSEENFCVNKTLISSVYGIDCFSKSVKYWDLIKRILDNFLNICSNNVQSETSHNINTKLLVWERISQCLILYLKEKSFEFRIVSKAELLNKWIFLPIEKYARHLNDDLIKCWNELTICASKSEGRSNFLEAVSKDIYKLNLETEKNLYLSEIINTVIECADTRFDQCTYPKEIFMLMLMLFTSKKVSTTDLNKIIEKFTSYIKQLEQNELNLTLNDLIAISKCLKKLEQSKSIGKKVFDIFKENIQDLISKRCSSNQVKEYKQALKSFDDFVIIPSVWTMNPDRLTEHQKEKMKMRKNNLPALYNDMNSHSEESYSLKSWTPNKIVIAKNKDKQEIVLSDLNEKILDQSPAQEENSTEEQNSAQEQNSAIKKFNFENAIKDGSANINVIQNEEIKQNNNNSITSKTKNVLANDCETNDEVVATKNFSVISKSETSNIEDSEATRTNSKITINKNVTKRRRSISRDDEQLLRKMNLQVDDEETKFQIIKNLKLLEINTIGGKDTVHKKISGMTTRRSTRTSCSSPKSSRITSCSSPKSSRTTSCSSPKSSRITRRSFRELNEITGLENTSAKNKKQIPKRKSSNDEIIQSSQQPSQSLISRRITRHSIALMKRPSYTAETNRNKNHSISKIKAEPNSDPVVTKQSNEINEMVFNVNSDSSSVVVALSPDSEKVIELSSNNIFEADTQINTEEVINETNESCCVKQKTLPIDVDLEQFSRTSPIRKSPRKQLNFDSKPKEKDCNSSPKLLSFEDVTESLQSPIFSPIKSQVLIEEEIRNSILRSPENQTLEQTKEFICNTSNISPIEQILRNTIEMVNDKSVIEDVLEPCYDLTKEFEMVNDKSVNEDILEPCYDLTKEFDDITNDVDKQLSPTRKSITQNLLCSPSDRKKTINTLSPVPKSKPSTLTGRGAQLINMIRNRKSGGQTVLKNSDSSVKRVLETSIINNPCSPKNSNSSKSGVQTNLIASTPQSLDAKTLLTFSKVLPSPYASPSVSILKRKADRLSMDENEIQASKRKRVGFSDPVSITKEYAIQPEEDRTSSSPSVRSALQKALYPTTKLISGAEQIQKHLLKRKSRVASMIEIAKYSEDILSSPNQSKKQITNFQTNSTPIDSQLLLNSPLQQISPVSNNDGIKSLKLMNENTNANINNENQQHNSANSGEELIVLTSPPTKSLTSNIAFTFPKDEDVLDYVLNKYTLDDLLLKYAEKTKKNTQDLLTIKSVKILIKEIMNSMALDQKIQAHVFETLSEKHPKEYLDHAIQENLCTVVCDRLDLNSVLNYIFEKSKINNQCYRLVLENIYQMFKTDKYISDKYELLQNLLKSKLQLSTEEILNCIELLFQHKNITNISQISTADTTS